MEKSSDFNAIWNENIEFENPLFVGTIRVYSDKTATTLKENPTVAYLVQNMLMNWGKEYRRFLIGQGHTLVGILPVFASERIENRYINDATDVYYLDERERIILVNDKPHQTAERYCRDSKLEILYDALQRILEPLSKVIKCGFEVHSNDKLRKCHPFVVSYCCNLPESKNMIRMMHVCTLHPCVQCSSVWDYIYT